MKGSRGKRILMLLENNPYPQDFRVNNEALTLSEAGYHVSVICQSAKGQPRHEVIDGVWVYRYPAPPAANSALGYLWEYGYSLIMMFALSLVVFMGEGFDVIHTHNPPDILVLIVIPYKLLGKQFVFDHHDLSPEMYQARFEGDCNRILYSLLLFFEKLSFRVADHIISTNQSYKSVAMERGKLPEERITIVRNGPNLHRLRIVDPDPEIRQKARTILGYVGVMGFQDGLDYLLRSLQYLVCNLERTDFLCVLIGDGDAWDSLKALATELGIDKYVWFTGRISHGAVLSRYLSSVDICVDSAPKNPYNDRSTMIKMMEYMALRKPTVAFDLTEHRFTAQEAALYVRPNDECEFAHTLVKLMDNAALRETMGIIGRRRVEEELAWRFSAKNLLSVYSLFTASKPKGK